MKLQQYSEDQPIWFTSDTHFSHENIIHFCHRPFKSVEEMNEQLIKNWNARVAKDDVVYHLGDFSWGGSDNSSRILEQLNGKIHLIFGNHDGKLGDSILAKFAQVTPQTLIMIGGRKIYLSHFPFLCYTGVYKKPEQAIWSLFGHVHTCPENNLGEDFGRLQYCFPTQYDVGVDFNNYAPISYAEIKNKINYQVEHNCNLLCWTH